MVMYIEDILLLLLTERTILVKIAIRYMYIILNNNIRLNNFEDWAIAIIHDLSLRSSEGF